VLRIGLTGGIGSGKSTTARIFEVLGIPVYYADEAARQLMTTDKELKASLIKNFGEHIYKNDELDRACLAKIVFADKKKLELLNALTHPATIRDADRWMQQQTSPYSIKEAALLFESGASKYLDHVIGVYAPEALRIKRAMARDNFTKEEILQRMKGQMDEDAKMKLCDSVIVNDEEQLLIPQVLKLHEKFLHTGKLNFEPH
jgi:dephospho-CoA kinase